MAWRPFSQMGSRIDMRAGNIERFRYRLVQRAALAIDSAVVRGTPVDTGRARSNWLPSIGRPRFDTVETFGAGAAETAIAAMRATAAALRPGQAVYLSNNLPYIGRLNDGWSAQAPAGFIGQAIRAGIASLTGVTILRS